MDIGKFLTNWLSAVDIIQEFCRIQQGMGAKVVAKLQKNPCGENSLSIFSNIYLENLSSTFRDPPYINASSKNNISGWGRSVNPVFWWSSSSNLRKLYLIKTQRTFSFEETPCLILETAALQLTLNFLSAELSVKRFQRLKVLEKKQKLKRK